MPLYLFKCGVCGHEEEKIRNMANFRGVPCIEQVGPEKETCTGTMVHVPASGNFTIKEGPRYV